ncbi:phosphodiester glycosidase family protein [Paenibacillus albiflavus]|uniref:Phosphodiester glycosidase family protein n=1 Tax=Paenibacillus albiflavus TaxID=2545760 RepID=A0A4R4E0X7_9BACL|nr:phosphodiester glycosidase family protein [Paenibacillus albiflavus]TCZ73039.1 phosphodiester glycosidase family protein [Paenibacillus albiflavus]
MNKVQALNRLMLLCIAPFIGMLIWLMYVNLQIEVPAMNTSVDNTPIKLDTAELEKKLDDITVKVTNSKSLLDDYKPIYEASALESRNMLQIAAASAALPESIIDGRITSKLGRTVRHEASENLDLKLFVLNEGKYTGYAMKVRLKSDQAMRVVLSKDQVGELETTQQAVNRLQAVVGVNAGGYIENKTSKHPVGTIVTDKQFHTNLMPAMSNPIFIGLNSKLQLVGSAYQNQTDIEKLEPLFGVTAGPILIQNKQKVTISSELGPTTKRSARTVIASFEDQQLLFLVIDGDEKDPNAGATLAELQDKLVSLGVKNAYNLDGAGASTLIWNDEMMNLPAEGKAKPAASHFLFFK